MCYRRVEQANQDRKVKRLFDDQNHKIKPDEGRGIQLRVVPAGLFLTHRLRW